jgi:hypothetical protein
MKQTKLSDLIKEGFAWERNADGSMPTLADTTRKHAEAKAQSLALAEGDGSVNSIYEKSVAQLLKLRDLAESVNDPSVKEHARKSFESIMEAITENIQSQTKFNETFTGKSNTVKSSSESMRLSERITPKNKK